MTTEPLISPSDLPIACRDEPSLTRQGVEDANAAPKPTLGRRALELEQLREKKKKKKSVFFASGLLTALPSFFPYTCACSKKKKKVCIILL